MQREHQANGPVTYRFDSLTDHPISAHISTRHGGVSPAPWDTLNFSVSRGDSPENVRQNQKRLANALGLKTEEIVRCRQVHGTNVAKVDWTDAGRTYPQTDALITDAPNLPLCWLFADCTPVLIYDPVRHVLGGCHAGWRGTVNGVAVATLWAMQAAYGTEPSDAKVCIGPSIGPESYEVGQEVVDMAYAKLKQAKALFTYPNGIEKNPHFNLWQANANQLIELGVAPEQIEISGIDTAQTTHDFYSHRAENGQCGLFSMVAWLEG